MLRHSQKYHWEQWDAETSTYGIYTTRYSVHGQINVINNQRRDVIGQDTILRYDRPFEKFCKQWPSDTTTFESSENRLEDKCVQSQSERRDGACDAQPLPAVIFTAALSLCKLCRQSSLVPFFSSCLRMGMTQCILGAGISFS